ncbi:TIGR01621 family pseudouridine synthase [Alteromonas sp. C1M14]|uniref:TIGR01621 family pseudouridine synthase n=1 Tax=Alteromonas sp. C1M14 TaxID=2841567 RepID=UPI001C08CDD3|nr:TIGR01621 family pseudouridine synthase [Alteromonas sp. C1M14]
MASPFSSADIVFTHPDFYIVNKPVGTPMHDGENGIITVLAALTGESRLYLCHRLDTVTSGCLLIGRNPTAAAQLSQLFSQRQIQKFYLAVLSTKPSKKQGTLVGDMKNRRRGQHVLLKTRHNPAVTQFFSYHLPQVGRVALVKPLTGKTHQIRVAMKSLGAPIAGDTLYGGAAPQDRVSLHAYGLVFIYQNQTFRICCPPNEGHHFTADVLTQWLPKIEDIERMKWPKFTLPTIKKPSDTEL